ncbi:MAG: O-antigen ligase family protein [Betaproteobacteria bacterium]|nr:O-antigen ligase family protein [Betaproteobacteria bacterium]
MTRHPAVATATTADPSRWQAVIAALLAVGAGLAVLVLGDLSLKYRVAIVGGVVATGFLLLSPDRRIWSLIFWVLVMPLSVEKVFYVAPAVWSGFVAQSVTINAADAFLVLLALFLLVKSLLTPQQVFYWPKAATAWLLFLAWAGTSYAMHLGYLHDGLVSASPLALLRAVRILVFIVLVHSAIRSRGDVLLVLGAVLAIVLLESALVGLSYVTGHVFNFTELTGGNPVLALQKYAGSGGGSGGLLVRGSGTLGSTNDTAKFETFYSLILLAFFGVRNAFFRTLALCALLAAGMAILLSFSRGAWLSFALALVLAFALLLRRGAISQRAWLTGAGVGILVVIALGALATPIMDRLSNKGDEGATASRLRMFHVAFDLASAYPIIGVGPGEYAQAGLQLESPQYGTAENVALGSKPIAPLVGRLDVVSLARPGQEDLRLPLPVHNRFLLVLAQMGAIGLLLWLLLYRVFLRDALRCLKSRDRFYRFVGVAGLAYLLAALVYMNVDLFDDTKSIEVLLFVPVVVTAVARLVREEGA